MIAPQKIADAYDQHASRLLLIARSMRIDHEFAEDAVHEAFVALSQQDECPVDCLAWLVRVVRNRSLQWKRGRDRRSKRERLAGSDNWFQSIDRDLDDRLDGHFVTESLMKIPSPQREIIVMHLWGEMTFDQISDIVGGSRATVHRGYHAGLQQLRKLIHPTYCGAIENE